MKILIIGKGGREHALATSAKQSKLVKEVFIAPGSSMMVDVATLVDIQETQIDQLVDFAIQKNIDLTIVGPENALEMGIVDAFTKANLTIFGPTQKAARIESSKDYAKNLMQKYQIPTAAYQTFTNKQEAIAYVQKQQLPIVIKEDGLKAGKGVVICQTIEETIQTLEDVFKQENKVVIEECLFGEEFSLMAFVNGDLVIPMEIAQDHKRVFDNDEGANTGGMGAYSPVLSIPQSAIEEAMEKVMIPTAKALVQENNAFVGFLYGGFMLTKDGVKTIEFNSRFGDPEAEVILPRLKSDFIKVILKVLDKKFVELEWDQRVSLGVVLASSNYPQSSTLHIPIEGYEQVNAQIFHMGTTVRNGQLLTNGGRVMIVVGMDESLSKVQENVYKEVAKIQCEHLFYRKDIGNKGLRK